ncbi:MAG: 2-aminoethylphosphonate--pyruvate transaminase, partial [Hyphomicrobiales bacterium]
LTPGPLTTSARTKRAMLRDWGSWDGDFKQVTAEVNRLLLDMCDAQEHYECVPIQGSGTFAIEAALGSLIPAAGRTLVLTNGAYGQRAAKTLKIIGRDFVVHNTGDYRPADPGDVAALLARDPKITHVVVVHCETSSGILNPLPEIADAVHGAGRKLIVDAMSSFGAIALSVKQIPFWAMVSSANKCIEGVPGFGFVIARREALEGAAGNCHSLSLDLHDQWTTMVRTGQWRFTPPTNALVAFREALRQHMEEGGVAGRLARYRQNRDALVAGMRQLGFQTLLDDRWLSPIIVTFFYPGDPAFNFERFYAQMKAHGFIIYPGKLTQAGSFRIGCIGQIDTGVIAAVLDAVRLACVEMGVTNCRPPASVGS